MKTVFYNAKADEHVYGLIREQARGRFHLETLETGELADALRKVENADAIVVGASLQRPVIEAARNLQFVHHQGVGYQDTVDMAALAERSVPLAIMPVGTTDSVAEHTIMLILAALRRLSFADAEIRRGPFHVMSLRPVSRQLSELTVGLVGFGRIGQAVSKLLQPFRCRVMFHDPSPTAQKVGQEMGLKGVSFDELVAEADILTLHMPLTPTNMGLFDLARLKSMKPNSFIVNTSRGPIIDEAALLEVLQSGHLAGAALDVFVKEPTSADNPLFALPNIVVTPHIAGGTRDSLSFKMGLIFDNLERFWAGEPARYLVTGGRD